MLKEYIKLVVATVTLRIQNFPILKSAILSGQKQDS